MKVLERVEWSHEFTCKGCSSKLVAEKADVRAGQYGSFDDYELAYFVECSVCKERHRWVGKKQIDSLPADVKQAAREGEPARWTVRLFIFGCRNHESGHYLREAFADDVLGWRTLEEVGPWKNWQLDAKLLPERIGGEYEPEGRAFLRHRDGWTALSWWDRSVDKRGKSNFSLLTDSVVDGEALLAMARERIPSVMTRFTYPIVVEASSAARAPAPPPAGRSPA